jgi:hypothetical protein
MKLPYATLLLLCLGLSSCQSQKKADPLDTMGRLNREFDQSRTKDETLKERKSPYDGKMLKTKSFQTKEYQTKASTLRKLWNPKVDTFRTKDFATKAYKTERSTFEGQESRLAAKSYGTKAFWQADKQARTKAFAGADKTFSGAEKTFATKGSSLDGKAFWAADKKANMGSKVHAETEAYPSGRGMEGGADVDSIRKLLGKPTAEE